MKTQRKMFISLGVGFIVYLIMMVFTLPYISSNGLNPVFDMHSFGYSINDALLILSGLTEQQRAVYLFIQIPLDLIYPMSLGLFTYYAFELMQSKIKFLKELKCIAFLMTFFDYMENLFVVIMLHHITSDPVIKIASTFTQLKSISVMVILSFLLILSLVYFSSTYIKKVKTKNEYHKS